MRAVNLKSVRALLSVAVALSAACASSGSTESTEAAGATPSNTITLRIENDHRLGMTFQVYLLPEAGQRQLIGTAAAGATLAHTFTGVRGAQYRLLAENMPESVTSPSFRPLNGTYTWMMNQNQIRQTGR